MKIGFIAMSGIRACDSELLALGLTLPGFVERSKAIASLPSLGLLTLAGMTPARHERRYIEVADLDGAGSLPADLDLVAISSFSAQIKEAYRLAQRYQSLGVPVTMGGLHVTMNPGEPQPYGASAVLGEGEVVWREVLEDAERGQLRAVYDARGREFDLARAPMPAFELLDMRRYNRITVQTSRGCPWRCSFCASSILLTRRYKQKPAHKVLEEIDRIRTLWLRPFIEFADDNSFVNRRYWRELLPELAKRRIRWFTETDLAVHEDEELLHMMREAGCVEVLIGFESPVAQGLPGLELRRDWKYARHTQYQRAIERIQAAGIRVNACFVVGLDGHDPSVFDAVLGFVREARPFDVQVTVPTPFPGTPFYSQLKAEGRLLADDAWERCTLFDINFQPSGMTVEELRAGLKRLVVALYSEEATRERREHFRKHCLRRAPAPVTGRGMRRRTGTGTITHA
jgi:radical SAM superfamily enzyme YgiQ (UPF0313 family)